MSYEFKEEGSRFVALDSEGNEAGEISYTREGDDTLVIDHTEVNSDHQGQGLGGQLVEQVVGKARSENAKIKPLCPYAKKKMESKEEYQAYLQE